MESTLYRPAAPDAESAPEPAARTPIAATRFHPAGFEPGARSLIGVPQAAAGPRPRVARLVGVLVGLAVRAGARVIMEMRIRRDRRHLLSLSDHMLKDIGLTRAEITHAVYHGRKRDED